MIFNAEFKSVYRFGFENIHIFSPDVLNMFKSRNRDRFNLWKVFFWELPFMLYMMTLINY